MSEEKKEDNTSILALLAIFVGMYIFLFGFIKNRATSGITVFFGGLSVFFVELFGGIVAYDQLNKTRNPDLVGFYPLFFIALFFYIMLVIKAFQEHHKFHKEIGEAYAAMVVSEAMEQAKLREEEEKRLQEREKEKEEFRARIEAIRNPPKPPPYAPWEENTTITPFKF